MQGIRQSTLVADDGVDLDGPVILSLRIVIINNYHRDRV